MRLYKVCMIVRVAPSHTWPVGLACHVPDCKAQRQHAQSIAQKRGMSGVNLPSPPERNARGQQHQHSSKLVHAPVFSSILLRILSVPAAPPILTRSRPRLTPLPPHPYRERSKGRLLKGTPSCLIPPRRLPNRPQLHSRRPPSTPRTAPSRPRWWTLAAGTCRSNIPVRAAD